MTAAFRNAILFRDLFHGGRTPDRSRPLPADAGCPARVPRISNWLDPWAFKCPIRESPRASRITTATQAVPPLGNTDSQIAGLGYDRTDMSLFKSVCRMSQSQVRADIFNLLNNVAFVFSARNNGPNGGVIGPDNYRCLRNNAPNSSFFHLSLRYSDRPQT